MTTSTSQASKRELSKLATMNLSFASSHGRQVHTISWTPGSGREGEFNEYNFIPDDDLAYLTQVHGFHALNDEKAFLSTGLKSKEGGTNAGRGQDDGRVDHRSALDVSVRSKVGNFHAAMVTSMGQRTPSPLVSSTMEAITPEKAVHFRDDAAEIGSTISTISGFDYGASGDDDLDCSLGKDEGGGEELAQGDQFHFDSDECIHDDSYLFDGGNDAAIEIAGSYERLSVGKFSPDDKTYYEPTENDVLCGRGSLANKHNERLYKPFMLKAQVQYKLLATNKAKSDFSQAITMAYQAEYGGRFLQMEKRGKSVLWFEVPQKQARRKVAQFLRDDHREEARAAKRVKHRKEIST
jgi:hypothetical protein